MTERMDEAAKIAWGNDMRRQFSPAGVCLEDGSINQDYFKPKKIIIQLNEAKRWGEPEKAALLKVGISIYIACREPRSTIWLTMTGTMMLV